MNLSALDDLLWATGFVVDVALLAVLVGRGRWRNFPVFTTWIAFQIGRTITLFMIYRFGNIDWYAPVYWTGLWLDFALQAGVAMEIARIVLRPTGSWVRDARAMFLMGGAAGMVAAAGIAWWVSPPTQNAMRAWTLRGNLFTSLVICELFVVMTMTANRLGLGWRNHVMALEQGLTGWTAVMVVSTALQTFWGSHHYFRDLEHVRMVSYDMAMGWVMVQLWRPEPERQPISPELQSYILALHKRAEYDLRRLDA